MGKGGFGKVWKVQSKKTKEIYALKEMSKLKIIDKKSEKSINSERTFLAKLNHPLIVNMHYAFQDNDNLYLVMDMLSGGDLRYHISRHRKFSEEQTRFFIGGMIIALEYIHKNNVIHRDIKPENLVLDEKGYVRITDFGIAKENCPDNSSETSGTPGYMSPEVMKGKNHSFEVDFFAIGVIGYEFMNGKRPYVGRNRREIKDQMTAIQAKIKLDELIPGWSNESADFINQLLIRRPSNRLGFNNGAKDLMEHPWLKYYPWEELKNKQLPSPFIPEKKDNFDKHYCESVDRIGPETQMRYEEIIYETDYQKVFVHFQFNKEEHRLKQQQQQQQQQSHKQHQKETNNTNNNNKDNPKSPTSPVNDNNNINLNHNHPLTKSHSTFIPPASSHLIPSATNKQFSTVNANKPKGSTNQNGTSSLPNSKNAQRPPSQDHKSSSLSSSSHHHHRPLSHSYSTKDVKQFQNRNALPQSDSRKVNPSSNKYRTNEYYGKSKIHSNHQSHDIIQSLFNKLPSSSSNKTLHKHHGRSSSLTNIANKKHREYFQKLGNVKGKTNKTKLNRADSVSALNKQSLLQKIKSGMIPNVKVKNSSGSCSNTLKRKKEESKEH